MNNDQYYMQKAIAYSKNSNDTRRKVGCCIVNTTNDVVSYGYNNPPNGYEDYMTWELGQGLDNKHLYVVHAELNAILSSQRDLNDCIIYTTLFPCNECTKAIIQSGIKEVVYIDDVFKDLDTYKASKTMLEKCGIKYRKVNNNDNQI